MRPKPIPKEFVAARSMYKNTVYMYANSGDARDFVRRLTEFGQVEEKNDRYILLISPVFDCDEVFAYIQSYNEESDAEDRRQALRRVQQFLIDEIGLSKSRLAYITVLKANPDLLEAVGVGRTIREMKDLLHKLFIFKNDHMEVIDL